MARLLKRASLSQGPQWFCGLPGSNFPMSPQGGCPQGWAGVWDGF